MNKGVLKTYTGHTRDVSIIRLRAFPALLALAFISGIFSFPTRAQDRQENETQAEPGAVPVDVTASQSAAADANAGQPTQARDADFSLTSSPAKDDRLLYTLPNYLTVENSNAGSLPPLRVKDKFKLVAKDSFDLAEYPFLGLQAGIAQATNSPSEIRQDFTGYVKRYGIAFADNTIGNFMTEAVFPSMLRQDPRYYQKGQGGFLRRFGYTVSRSFITRSDSGRTEFNYSEISGNAVAAGISNLYYPRATRGWSNTLQEWWVQIGWDTAANLLREFWPDLHRKISRKTND